MEPSILTCKISLTGRGVPVATVIGGGYDKSLEKLSLRHSIIHRAATNYALKYKVY